MKLFLHTQEVVGRFNDDAEICRCYERLCCLRRRVWLGVTVMDDVLDRLDRLKASWEGRSLRFIGMVLA